MTNEKTEAQKRKKYWTQVGIGAVFGFFGAFFGLEIIDSTIDPDGLKLSIELILAGCVAIIYLIIGLMIGLSLMLPKKYATKMLNVEDEEELADQKRILLGSSISMGCIGAAMFILILSGTDGYFAPIIGFSAMSIAFILAIIIAVRDWPYYDEMMRKTTIDSTYLCAAILFTIVWFWCSAAWLGWIEMPSPLILLALFNGIYLLSVFIISGRMGLMEIR